jgi:hypothetical protein
MERLVPAIMDAWRAAERQVDDLPFGSLEARTLVRRIHVLQSAHAMATDRDVDRATVVRFLEEHGFGDIVPPASPGPATPPA